MFKVLDHEMVPRHEILTSQEKKEVLERFNIDKEKLPKVLDSGPAVKEVGAKAGDVIRIIRKSQTAGESVYYRVVVSG